MDRKSFICALRKAASEKIGQSAPVKKAQAAVQPSIWDSVMAKVEEARKWYEDPKNRAWHPAVHAGIGALGIGALNKLLGGSFGRGAILGGIGGAVTGVDWKALADSLGKKKDEPKKENNPSAPAQQ